MSAGNHTFEHVKAVISSCHECIAPEDKIHFYDNWAKDYDQDVSVLEYRAPVLAANCISSHFSGDRESAVVLDVACGTGLAAKQMRKHGFGHFMGVDGSEAMLELAKETGLYKELKQLMLGHLPLPVQWGLADVVMMVGALSGSHAPVSVIRELCKATKPGGFICVTSRGDRDNMDYKTALESEMKQMETEGLWSCVEVNEVKDFERAVVEQEGHYIPGSVYLYRKL